MGRQGATDGHFDRGALSVYLYEEGERESEPVPSAVALGKHVCRQENASPGQHPLRLLAGMASPVTKILLLGPIKSGKSCIATFLGETGDWEANETYRPTKAKRKRGHLMKLMSEKWDGLFVAPNHTKNGSIPGVRIIDFESREEGGYKNVVEIELWDCSGDIKYRDCWPAMKDDAQGVILVADPDENTADDLLPWYNEFVQKAGIDNENVLVLLNEKGDRRTNQENIAAFKLIKDVKYLAFNLRHEGDILRENISAFILKIRQNE